MATTICIVNQKGGVGKTTTTIELAATLTEMEKKVLVVDLDQQSNISFYTMLDDGEEIKNTVWEVLKGDCLTAEAIVKSKYYDLLPASKALSNAEVQFRGGDSIFLLADILEEVQETYDYIVIDTNPARNILLNMAYLASDKAIIVSESDKGSIEGLLEIIRDIKKMQNSKHMSVKVQIAGFVLNKMENTTMHKMGLETLEKIKEQEGLNDAWVLPVKKTIKISECKEVGVPLQDYAYFTDTAQEFRMIAHRIYPDR
jgi:chromosome partitioning protein